MVGESLPSNLTAQVRFLAGSGILIYILGFGGCILCVLSCVVSSGGPDSVLTILSGRPVLMYLSGVLVHSLLLLLQAYDLREFGY